MSLLMHYRASFGGMMDLIRLRIMMTMMTVIPSLKYFKVLRT